MLIFKARSLKTFSFISSLRQMEDTRPDCPWTPFVYDLRQCAHYAVRFRKYIWCEDESEMWRTVTVDLCLFLHVDENRANLVV